MNNADVTVRNVSIAIGILILLPLAVNVGIDIVNPQPKIADYTDTKSSEKWFSSKGKPAIDQEAYDAAMQIYRKKYFYASTVFGIASIVIGGLVSVPFLGTGFILGGVICLTMGYWTYWNMIHQIIKLISLLLALLFLVFMGYRLATTKRQN